MFTTDSWSEPYTVKQRSYLVNSDNNGFKPGKISNSIIGDCLAGIDNAVRLDYYINKLWRVEYCYLLEDDASNE